MATDERIDGCYKQSVTITVIARTTQRRTMTNVVIADSVLIRVDVDGWWIEQATEH